MTPDRVPDPAALSTLPLSSSAPYAIPRYCPSEAAPVPAMVAATWVPCPASSVVVGSSVKLASCTTTPARSGWVVSMPESSTAMVMPSPVKPDCHASGGADLRGAVVQQAHDLPVQPNLLLSRQRGRGHRPAALGARLRGQGVGQQVRLVLVHLGRGPVDGGEEVGGGHRRDTAHRGDRIPVKGDDDRNLAGAGVVVPLLRQQGEVEQGPVEEVRYERGHIGRDEIDVPVLFILVE